MTDIKDFRHDRHAIYTALVDAGGKPAKGNMFHCPYHKDGTASAWIKLSSKGYYFKCFTCNLWLDAIDLAAKNKGISVGEFLKENFGQEKIETKHAYHYKNENELIESIDCIAVEEVNKYTNPETGNVDLLVIRYLPRGEQRKAFLQAHMTEKGYIKKRPAGLLPLFNRTRLKDSDTVIFVEGEKCVRTLTELGFVASTGSGGASNASGHDYSPLSGKTVILWPDNDEPGKRYMEQVRDKLLELDPVPTVYIVDISELELPDGGDVVDLIERAKAEGGTKEDCKIQVELAISDVTESNKLEGLETLLDDMREGKYTNLPIMDMPILTHEARMLLNKKIAVLYGNAGFGKSLLVGKASDDLALRDIKVARLQLEDELELHLLRSFAQQAGKSEVALDEWHKNNPEDSRDLYEAHKATLEYLAPTVYSGEHEDWNVPKLLDWVEQKLKLGMELVIIDPVTVIMGEKIWIDSHKMVWGLKKLLAQYPNGRVILVAHPNDNGEVGGGKAYRRFCHTLLVLNRFKKPKEVKVLDINGNETTVTAEASIGISKTRYGKGNGLEIAVKLNSQTLCIEELGVIVGEINDISTRNSRKPVGRNLEEENRLYNGAI
jgi:hypothetical protein